MLLLSQELQATTPDDEPLDHRLQHPILILQWPLDLKDIIKLDRRTQVMAGMYNNRRMGVCLRRGYRQLWVDKSPDTFHKVQQGHKAQIQWVA
jgi:hypothetical protein